MGLSLAVFNETDRWHILVRFQLPTHIMKLTATTALLVSLLSLAVSAWSAYKTNENTTLAYRPYVITTPMFDDSGKKHGIYLSNAGLGPAAISSISVAVDGRVYTGLNDSIWPQFIRDMKLTSSCFRTGWPASQSVVRVSEDDPLFVLTDNASLMCQMELATLLAQKDIEVTIGYASLFGQNYVSRNSVRLHDDALLDLTTKWHRLTGQ
jgi:hypothetical protein